MIHLYREGKLVVIEFSKYPINSMDLQFLKEFYYLLLKIDQNPNIFGVVLRSKINNIFSSNIFQSLYFFSLSNPFLTHCTACS